MSELAETSRESAEQVVNDVKYAGYVDRQEMEITPPSSGWRRSVFRPRSISELSSGCVRKNHKKLCRIRPASLAQAARISGITPPLGRVSASISKRNGRFGPICAAAALAGIRPYFPRKPLCFRRPANRPEFAKARETVSFPLVDRFSVRGKMSLSRSKLQHQEIGIRRKRLPGLMLRLQDQY